MADDDRKDVTIGAPPADAGAEPPSEPPADEPAPEPDDDDGG
jgi:hypothetical protein